MAGAAESVFPRVMGLKELYIEQTELGLTGLCTLRWPTDVRLSQKWLVQNYLFIYS